MLMNMYLESAEIFLTGTLAGQEWVQICSCQVRAGVVCIGNLPSLTQPEPAMTPADVSETCLHAAPQIGPEHQDTGVSMIALLFVLCCSSVFTLIHSAC